jgi:hypothetical protein
MNQHNIQKAYLKTFADKRGRVWVYAKTGGRPVPKSPADCGAEDDFQSSELELYQNRLIETPGIKTLRVDGSLSEREFEQMSMWMGLHIIRAQKSREQLFESAADYEQGFHDELQKEHVFSAYYRYAYTHTVSEPNFVITSDDPVIEFTGAGFIIRACALSSCKLIFFSPVAGRFEHEVATHDFFNAMMWGASGDRLYSHRHDLRVETLKEIAHAYHLHSVIEDLQFQVLGGAEGL